MDYLSILRVLDTDYKIRDEEAARTNHTHSVEEIEGAAKEGHQHQASEIAGLSTVATSGSYSDLEGKPSAATASADGLMSAADKKKLDGIAAGAQANADAIAAEATRAKAAESANAKAVTDEAARAKKAEADNASAIKSEAARAAKAEGANSDAVKAEADARANADAAIDAAYKKADAALGKRIDAAKAETGANSADLAGIKSLTYGSGHAQLVKNESGNYSSPAMDEIAEQIESGTLFVAEYGVTPFAVVAQHVPNVVADKDGTFGTLVLKDEYQAFFVAASASSGAHIAYKVTPDDKWTNSVVTSNWDEIGDKPFSAIGAGLTVTNGTLSADVKAAPVQAIAATAPITATAKDGTVTIATDGTLATVEGVASEAKSRADADSALAKRVTAAETALAQKPDAASTSLSYRFKLDCNKGKYWFRLGTLVSAGDDSSVHLHVLTGHGYNGLPYQNSEFWVFIKDGWTEDGSTSYFGTTVELGANCEGVQVRVYAANDSTADVWVRLPWDYPNGNYTIHGVYRSWTPNTKPDNQTGAPSSGSMVDQYVSYRTIASTDYVDGKVGGCQPRGDYAAKSHAHAASDVTSGVLPVARGGTGNGSGNAPTASRLASARTIALTGAVTGSAKFDGSGNVNISTTANESYISSPISGLYNMAVDADGNLWVYHSDSDKAPNFEYDPATGNLYYVTEA